MDGEKIKYQLRHKYLPVTNNTANIDSNCYSIMFENQGTLNVDLIIDEVKRTLEPGDIVEYGANDPAMIITTLWSKVEFAAGAGTKKLFITKEHLTPYAGKC